MARGAINEVNLNTRTGVSWPGSETTGDPANGHFFVFGPRKILHCRNTSGTTAYSIIFTQPNVNLDALAPQQKTVSMPANSVKVFSLPAVYDQPTDGDRVYVDVQNAALVLKVWNVGKG